MIKLLFVQIAEMKLVLPFPQKNSRKTNIQDKIRSLYADAVYFENPVINQLKKLAVSPITLIGILCFCLSIFISLFSNTFIIDYSSEVYQYVYDALSEYDLEGFIDIVNTASFLITFIGSLPEILIAVGMCLAVYTVFASQEETISTTGLSIINVIYTIYQVLAWLGIGLFGVLLFLVIVSDEFDGALFWIITAVLIGLIVGFAIRVYYSSKVKETIGCIKYCIECKIPVTQIPIVVIVVCFFVGIVQFAACFNSAGVATFFSAVSNILFGIALIKYKTDMAPLRSILNSTTSKKVQTIDSNEAHYNVETVTKKLDAKRNKTIIICVLALLVFSAIALLIYNNPFNIDNRIVGKWMYDSNDESIIQFKRNGTYIANVGTEYEERGKYSTENGMVHIVVDGDKSMVGYRVKSDNVIELERRYWGGYEWKTKWVECYKVN